MEILAIVGILCGIIFLLDNVAKYMLDCIKRAKTRKAAKERLERNKKLEEYVNEVYRFIDPNYYGD